MSKAVKGLSFERTFTKAGKDAYDGIEWSTRSAVLSKSGGEETFRQDNVVVPEFWSARATNITAEKYFRVINGVKEFHAGSMVNRVVDTITKAGVTANYFATAHDAQVFSDELTYMLIHQMFAFNSPVWFNVGVVNKPQGSACFIQKVDDTMESITDTIKKEMMLFKGGSGTGSNLSTLRSSYEKLAGGGYASGPVSFMEVLDAGAGVTKSGGTTRRAAKMVCMDISHPDILKQKNGRPGFITCKSFAEQLANDLYSTGKHGAEFNDPNNVYEHVKFQNANNSVRVTDSYMSAMEQGESWSTRAVQNGSVVDRYPAQLLWDEIAKAAWVCGDPGLQYDTTINKWHTCPTSGRINASNPCSEYMFLDDTACNLGSFNLVSFLYKGTFDYPRFIAANKICITAMEILVGFCSYPSPEITTNSHNYRPLGIGYANLGSLLMRLGMAYDSDEGRSVAAAITSLMTASSYAQSAEIAKHMGPFSGYLGNESAMFTVMQMHAGSNALVSLLPGTSKVAKNVENILSAAQEQWELVLSEGKKYGWRNSQISVLAPTGTIAFLMDCDTTGGEPMLALVQYKKLVGGGMMKMPNEAVFSALYNLGYAHPVVEKFKTESATADNIEKLLFDMLIPAHKKVFQTAIGDDPISVDGHLKMMAAQQPFISGAISKTVNMPSTATIEDIKSVYLKAWKLGLKAVALYRDGCKLSQPASSKLTTTANKKEPVQAKPKELVWGERRKLNDERPSVTQKLKVGQQEGYLHIGMYDDGKPAEIFLDIAKAGSAVAGFADWAATAMSIALQYGAPVELLVEKLKDLKFEPAGFTNLKTSRTATSIPDYVAKYMEQKFIPENLVTPLVPEENKVVKPNAGYSGPPCGKCSNMTQRAGSCWVCTSCGTTTGCG